MKIKEVRGKDGNIPLERRNGLDKGGGEKMTTKKMATLVIHAPANGKTPFSTIFATGVGLGYAIYESIISKLTIPGSTVVLLAKDQKLRAEGVLVKPPVRTSERISNAWRYDVHVEKFTMVPYKSEKLNPCGVAVID